MASARGPVLATCLIAFLMAGPAVGGTNFSLAPEESTTSVADHRYFGGLLDHRSIYGKFWFPEPLLNPEMDVDRELRFDWIHTERRGNQSNEVIAEVEYAINMLTLEVEVPYVNEREAVIDDATGAVVGHERSEGIGNIELSARHPVYQWVSNDEMFDYTLVAALEVAVPSMTRISHDTEIVPQVFQLLRLGEHLSVQASAGFSFLIGPDEGGTNAFEYGLTLGYAIERDQLALPGVTRLTPLVELSGETGLNRGASGENELLGVLGGRIEFEQLGPAQPRIGLGYVFPIDQGARDSVDWGIVTSIVFEY